MDESAALAAAGGGPACRRPRARFTARGAERRGLGPRNRLQALDDLGRRRPSALHRSHGHDLARGRSAVPRADERHGAPRRADDGVRTPLARRHHRRDATRSLGRSVRRIVHGPRNRGPGRASRVGRSRHEAAHVRDSAPDGDLGARLGDLRSARRRSGATPTGSATSPPSVCGPSAGRLRTASSRRPRRYRSFASPHLPARCGNGTRTQPNNCVEGRAVEFCQVVTQTRNVADTTLRVVGEPARRWMAIAQCFAGPPENPPAPGARVPVPG